ncbi:hypothetical protein [Kitasatospora sp. NPDC093558]|uniref:hypothetical protein n=1 Tax=Kitasatospora sp. NPDC093558 TaxID=3155201 RepID=UPI003434265A
MVADVAPEETILVEGLLRYGDAEVLARLRGRGRRDPLGFGVADIVPLVTPLLWLTLESARQKLADAAVDGAAKGSVALFRRLFRRTAEPEVIPALTREQQVLVRGMVVDAATQAGLAPELVGQLADGVVARLALAEPNASGGEEVPST